MIPATIQWFGATSGDGMVITAAGEAIYLNFTAIVGVDRHNWQWPNGADQERLRGIEGRACQVDVYRNLYSARVERAVIDGV